MIFSKQFKKVAITLFAVMVFSTLVYSLPPHGDEGCTPGYWKNHTHMWPIDYHPDMRIFDVFEMPLDENRNMLFPELEGDSLFDALKYRGGKGMIGAVRIYLRHAVAALLNVAHSDVYFYYVHSPEFFIWWRNKYFYYEREAMLAEAGKLAIWNEANCPLDNGKNK